MKGLVVASRGVEEAACAEINELTNCRGKPEDSCVAFDFRKFEDLCLLCYKSQSVDRVLYLIGSFEFSDLFWELEKFIGKLEFDEWLKDNKRFKVECIRKGSHDFKSVEVETKVGELILEKYKGKKIKADMKDYEIIFLAYITGNKCYFGIDFAGFELNKRNYKVFSHANSLRGTIAYSLIRESGFKNGHIALDPFSRDGVIPIEAALYANDFPVNYYNKEKFAFLKLDLGINYEKFFNSIDRKIKTSKSGIYSYDHLFKFVDYSKKNAKIAGVDKRINFSRTELEWLDIKFKKESVDRVITSLPVSSGIKLDKVYNEFFYQCEYILKEDGAIAIISRLPDLTKEHASRHNFSAAKEMDVWSGEQVLKLILFKKKSI